MKKDSRKSDLAVWFQKEKGFNSPKKIRTLSDPEYLG